MNEDRVERLLGVLDEAPVEPDPEFMTRLRQRVYDEATGGGHRHDGAFSGERTGDETVVDLRDFEAVRTRRQRDGWLGAVVAVAALALVVVGVVVMTDNSDGVVTETSSPSGGAEISVPAGVPDSDPASVWSRVRHDEAVFGGDGPQWMFSVTATQSGLVAVGREGPRDGIVGDMYPSADIDAAVWTSADGASWTRIPHDDAVFGGKYTQQINSVTAGGPGLVAVGFDRSGGDGDGAVWTSVDGVTWSRVPHDEAVLGGFGIQNMGKVTAGGPGLVAVGWDGSVVGAEAAVWTSVDGVTWSRVPHDEAVFGGPTSFMNDVTVGGPGLVAVGGEGRRLEEDAVVWTSVDGLIWSRVPHDDVVFGGDRTQVMESVVAVETGLWAVGWEGPGGGERAVVWASVDGVAWSRLPHDEAVFGGAPLQSMMSVTVVGSDLVAVGAAGPGDDLDAAVWSATTGS